MRALALAVATVLMIVAGCVAPIGERDAQAKVLAAGKNPVASAPGRGYVQIEPDLLTQPVFDILPLETARVPSSLDGITLFLDIVRPDTKEPVPTILHSSPYNQLERVPGSYPTVSYPQFALAQEYVPRGYAVVVADVRGFSESEGCVEIWGKNEQQDQYDMVEWIAEQPWSDGKVGMIGVSYPGTTPMEAAVMAPPHLTTIVAVAGLTDPYYDWHYGGVPNTESSGSTAAYHQLGLTPPVVFSHGVDWAKAVTNGGCNFTENLRASYQPQGLYTSYYDERNLSARVKNVKVPVLYTQGFTDGNVKPAQLLNWFNALDVPKKGIFGQWAHNNPERSDWDDYVHAWFDEHLMGFDTGIMAGPVAEITTNLETWRSDTAFPSVPSGHHNLYFDLQGRELSDAPPTTATEATYVSDRATVAVSPDRSIVLEGTPLKEALYVSGVVQASFFASIEGDSNTFFMAQLHDVAPDGSAEEIVYGGLNAALRESVRDYKPVPEGETIQYTLSFQPREYVIQAGHSLRLTIGTAEVTGSPTTEAAGPMDVTIHSSPETPSRLLLPYLAEPGDIPAPYS